MEQLAQYNPNEADGSGGGMGGAGAGPGASIGPSFGPSPTGPVEADIGPIGPDMGPIGHMGPIGPDMGPAAGPSIGPTVSVIEADIGPIGPSMGPMGSEIGPIGPEMPSAVEVAAAALCKKRGLAGADSEISETSATGGAEGVGDEEAQSKRVRGL
jgi:hypothetical protein